MPQSAQELSRPKGVIILIVLGYLFLAFSFFFAFLSWIIPQGGRFWIDGTAGTRHLYRAENKDYFWMFLFQSAFFLVLALTFAVWVKRHRWIVFCIAIPPMLFAPWLRYDIVMITTPAEPLYPDPFEFLREECRGDGATQRGCHKWVAPPDHIPRDGN
jgi:hypothetical protein